MYIGKRDRSEKEMKYFVESITYYFSYTKEKLNQQNSFFIVSSTQNIILPNIKQVRIQSTLVLATTIN